MKKAESPLSYIARRVNDARMAQTEVDKPYWTIEALAHQSGVSLTAVGHITTGKPCRIKSLLGVLDVLGLELVIIKKERQDDTRDKRSTAETA